MKVYFAGMEVLEHAIIASRIAGIKYALFSAYPFLITKFGLKPVSLQNNGTLESYRKYVFNGFRHTIMDSGIYSLMFGAGKEFARSKMSFEFMQKWQDALIDFTETSRYEGTIVDVDCQKILGVKEAWKLRKILRDRLPNEQINVFHVEDGRNGLKKLIDFSDYIGIGIPEWRRLKKIQNLETHIISLVRDIKRQKPRIKIHLLGCTQFSILRPLRFCESCDSTAWQVVNKYGTAKIYLGDTYYQFKRRDIEKMSQEHLKRVEIEKNLVPILKTDSQYLANYALTIKNLNYKYLQVCGDDQDF